MSYEHHPEGLDQLTEGREPAPRLMSARWPIGENVYNHRGEKLGDIKEIMLDVQEGKVAYAVLSFGGFLGIADKLFAVPWNALTLKLETLDQRFLLDVEKEHLESAPGFDKDAWPDLNDPAYVEQLRLFYQAQPSGTSRRSGTSR
ncbi:PRC-barrel domain-containing protein [Nitrosovibrio sp. Nv17]|uniref:PRC-barrel domain-containing protein n=1 Tax=Nitrosovibrio sp. Nv17 TaxID=1855339 RepID=UPI00090894E6|nr:PRC-barrel domain-containing protein [Nitrosovibrio sp. Nv17]SFW21266.1 PRC-barrel domain-containing protein [Nitrosovibrio sp. Nv17]